MSNSETATIPPAEAAATSIAASPAAHPRFRTAPADRLALLARPVIRFALIAIVGGGWFFAGIGHGDFIEMEALRAIVAQEMIEHDTWLPTVHDRIYLRKPPLHAWTTAAIARAAGGLDERVARAPSAALAVIYVLTIAWAARWLVDENAALAGAVFAAANGLVVQYSGRADLDIGVLAWTTLAAVQLLRAWYTTGSARGGWLVGAYAAALAGTFWKGPHVLLVVWMTVAGLIILHRGDRRRDAIRFARHPLQFALSLIVLCLMVLWSLALADAVGGERVSKFMLIELLARVVPHEPKHLLEILFFPLQFVTLTFPAIAFAAILLRPRARGALDDDTRDKLLSLAAWIVPTSLFLLLVPAKAPRYGFLMLGGITLMGTLAWRQYARGRLDGMSRETLSRVLHGLVALVALSGVALMCAGTAVLTNNLAGKALSAVNVGPGLVAAGGLTVIISGAALASRARRSRYVLVTAMLLGLVPLRIAHAAFYLPVVSDRLSYRPLAARIDAHVPADAPLFILSDLPDTERSGELADLDYYAEHPIRFPRTLDEAIARAQGQPFFVLARDIARRRVESRVGLRTRLLDSLVHPVDTLHLLRVEPSAERTEPAVAASPSS